MFNSDYFTIHPRDRSRDSSIDTETPAPSSSAGNTASSGNELVSEDIRDIPSLMKALKLSRIDREKSEAVKNFIKNFNESFNENFIVFYFDFVI